MTSLLVQILFLSGRALWLTYKPTTTSPGSRYPGRLQGSGIVRNGIVVPLLPRPVQPSHLCPGNLATAFGIVCNTVNGGTGWKVITVVEFGWVRMLRLSRCHGRQGSGSAFGNASKMQKDAGDEY